MVYGLLHFLKEQAGVKVPAVFFYTSTRMILAAVTGLLLSITLGPFFIKKLYELKVGESTRMGDCPPLALLHHKKKDTPTMGGCLIIFCMLAALLLWMDLSHAFTLILLLTTCVLGVVGGRDDYLKLKYKNSKGLAGKKKMFWQSLVAGLLALYLLSPTVNHFLYDVGFVPPVIKEAAHPISVQEYALRIYVPFFKEPVLIFSAAFAVISALFMMFVVVGSSNAVNLTDGLDGLAAGCLIMVAASLALIAFLSNNVDIAGYLNILYIEGSGEIAIYLSAFAGACLGFLWYNGYPAQVFMGDTGSLALGGIIGVSAVLLRREALLGVVGGVFVAEALSVIIQVGSYRWRNQKRIFKCAPLHHHFELSGWPESKVVIRFWIVGLLLAIVGIASLKFQ